MRRSIVFPAIAAAILVVGVFGCSGWWACWRLERALHQGDAPLVAAMVNEEAVRANLAADLHAAVWPATRADWLQSFPESDSLSSAVDSAVGAGSEWLAGQIDAWLVSRWLIAQHHRLERQSRPAWRTCVMSWGAVELRPMRPQRTWGRVVAIGLEREEGLRWQITYIKVRPLAHASQEPTP